MNQIYEAKKSSLDVALYISRYNSGGINDHVSVAGSRCSSDFLTNNNSPDGNNPSSGNSEEVRIILS